MNSPRSSIWKDLTFLHGHIADPQLAVSLAQPATPVATTTAAPRNRNGSTAMNFFKSLMYLGGLETVNLRLGEDEAFGPIYGNRLASAQAFGTPKPPSPAKRAPAPAPRTVLTGGAALGGCH